MSRRYLACLVVGSTLPLGCQGSGDGGGARSASFFASAPDSFRLSEEPLFAVGLRESLPLQYVRGALFLEDQTVIADGGPSQSQILFVDGQGQLLARQGRLGAGPGEYRFLAGLARYHNGLVAWDAGLSRLSLLDSAGEYLSSAIVRARSNTTLVGAFGGNVLFQWSDPGFSGEGTVGPLEIRLETEFMVVRPGDGEIVRTITLPGLEKWAQRTGRAGGSYSHGGPAIIFGRDGVGAVTRRRAYLGTTDSLTLTAYDEDGTATTLSMRNSAVRAQPEWVGLVRDSLREAIAARGPSPLPPMDDGRNVGLVLKEFRLALLEDLPARETLPAYSKLKGGADGRLWIREYPNPTQDLVAWVGINPSGQPEKRIDVPMGLEVMDISENRIIVLTRGPFGEHVVEVYSLAQRATP